MKLTKREVDAAEHPAAGQAFLWDSELKGFGLRLTPTRKTYIAQGRVGEKTVRVTLGQHGVFTADQARTEARKKLAELAKGVHINAEERIARIKSVTLAQAFEQYKKDKTFTPNTLRGYETAYKVGFADWSAKQIVDLDRRSIDARFALLSERSESQANLAFRFLRALLNWAMEKYASADGEPLIPSNPCNRLTSLKMWHKLDRRTGHIQPDQLRPWFAALVVVATDTEHHAAVTDFCAFVLLTGCREQEAGRLTWADVDLRKQVVTFTVTKNHRQHTLPIGDWLAGKLAARKVIGASSPFVFPAQNRHGHVKYHRDDVKAISAASGVSFTLHDLRRTFATIVNHQLGKNFSMYTIKRLLNHSVDDDVTGGYVQLAVEDLREPMCLIEAFVLRHAGIMCGSDVSSVGQEPSSAV